MRFHTQALNCRVDFTHAKQNAKLRRNPPFLIAQVKDPKSSANSQSESDILAPSHAQYPIVHFMYR